MPRNRAKRDAKNSRSAERGCSSVLPPPNRRRMSTASNLALLPTGYAAQSRKARCKKQPERRARMILCSPAAEQAANGWSPQPCLTSSRLCRAIAQSAMQKTAGAPSEDDPLFSRRRTGGEWLEPATLPTTSRLCRAIAQRCTNSSPPQNAARRPIRR